MRLRTVLPLFLLFVPVTLILEAQTAISWKKDHIYAGAGGKEIAVVTPPPSDTTVPTAPTGVTTSNVNPTKVQISWTGSTDSGGSGLAGYKVYRQRGTGASIPVGTTTGTTYFDEPLQPSTAYTYTVRAFDNAQNHSAASNSSSVTTVAWTGETSAPSVPPNLTAWATVHNRVQLTWNASTDAGGSGVAGYKIYRDGTNAGNIISGATPISALAYEDATVTAHTTHAYRVIAVDNAGNASALTNAVNVTTPYELWFSDDFHRPDSANLGSNWNSPQNPSFGITAGKATCNRSGLSPTHCRAFVNNISAGRFRATVNGGNYSGIAFWGNTNTGYYRWVIAGSIILYWTDNWSTEELARADPPPAGFAQPILEAENTTGQIRVYNGATLLFTVTETDTSRRTNLGVGIWADSLTITKFNLYKLP